LLVGEYVASALVGACGFNSFPLIVAVLGERYIFSKPGFISGTKDVTRQKTA
jgi:hypothetical protein